MKLIHCSDLHLDSPMESHLSAEQARERNHEILKTFFRLVCYARENHVDAVLIAGDLFDSNRITQTTADFVLDTITQASEVEFLYLKGNHDEDKLVLSNQEFPDNLHLFGESWDYVSFDTVTVAGVQLTRENWETIYDDLILNESQINIVTLHGQIATQPGEEQIALPLLRNRNIRYLALGHLHGYHKEPLDHEGEFCYCGCLEGRGFDECGEKGFVLVEVENHRLTTEFIPFASRQLFEVPVDITGLTTVTEFHQAMVQASADIDSRHLVKFVLHGNYTLETQKDLGFLQKMLSSRFWFVRIKDESHLKLNQADYQNDISLKGEFIRLVMASDRSDEEKEQIICCGLQALSGEEVRL